MLLCVKRLKAKSLKAIKLQYLRWMPTSTLLINTWAVRSFCACPVQFPAYTFLKEAPTLHPGISTTQVDWDWFEETQTRQGAFFPPCYTKMRMGAARLLSSDVFKSRKAFSQQISAQTRVQPIVPVRKVQDGKNVFTDKNRWHSSSKHVTQIQIRVCLCKSSCLYGKGELAFVIFTI